MHCVSLTEHPDFPVDRPASSVGQWLGIGEGRDDGGGHLARAELRAGGRGAIGVLASAQPDVDERFEVEQAEEPGAEECRRDDPLWLA